MATTTTKPPAMKPRATADGTPSAAAKKKKKKKKKKKTGGGGGGGGAAGSGAAGQTAPPTVPVSHLFNNVFPEGEIQHYKDDNVWRETSEEKRELERLEKNMYNEVRQCSEVHREVRRYISDWVKPGMKLIDVCGAFIFTISVIKRMGDQSETDVLFCLSFIFIGLYFRDQTYGQSDETDVCCCSTLYRNFGKFRPPIDRRTRTRSRHRVPHRVQPEPHRRALDPERRRQHHHRQRRRHQV